MPASQHGRQAKREQCQNTLGRSTKPWITAALRPLFKTSSDKK